MQLTRLKKLMLKRTRAVPVTAVVVPALALVATGVAVVLRRLQRRRAASTEERTHEDEVDLEVARFDAEGGMMRPVSPMSV